MRSEVQLETRNWELEIKVLLHSRIHGAEALGHDLEHDEGEVRRLLHEEEEAAAVDGDNFTISHGLRGSTAGAVIDQGHLAKGLIFFNRGEKFALDFEGYLSLTHHEHLIPIRAFSENRFASLEAAEIARALEQSDFDTVVVHQHSMQIASNGDK